MRLERTVSFLLAAILLLVPAWAFAEEAPVTDVCRAYVLVEADSLEVLADKNADAELPMASLTKMMTLLLTFEAIDRGELSKDRMLVISESAAGMGGSQAFLDAGASYSVDRLIASVIIGSANDSSVALAECLAGSETAFVIEMNERAKELGMTGTHFVNCSGLPAEGHFSTAMDLAVLSSNLISHDIYFDYSTTWLEDFAHPDGRTTMLANTNKLIRSGTGVDGIKTGFTNDAGFCLSATKESGGMRLIAVVLGGSDSKGRFAEAQELLEFGFANYELVTLDVPEGLSLEVRGGKSDSVGLDAAEGFSILKKRGEGAELTYELTTAGSLKAPVSRGDKAGEWIISDMGSEVGRIDLLTSEDVQRAGFADNFKSIIKRWYIIKDAG